MAIYGLLVGVNQYQDPWVNTLRGCENDVYLFSQTLQARFGIPEDHLKILLNAEATHQNIIDHFQRYLLDRDWKQYDMAVFYFSGHGAQSVAPEIFWDVEPDHLNESLVCHDSRMPGVPDLLDKELRYLIAQLAKKCGHIAVFLDCCHGGHGTRFPGDDGEEIRLAPVDTTAYPLDCFVFGQQAGKTLGEADPAKLVPDSGRHILLSGCQSFQLSREKPQGPAYLQHGLFTYALCETLSSLQFPISYQELRNRIHTRVQAQNAAQSPQIEAIGGANVAQTVLGGELLPLRLLAYRQKGLWVLNAGVMHGLNVGDEVALFGDAADVSKLDDCLAQAKIQQADSFTSMLEINGDIRLDGNEYTAIVTRQHFNKMPVRLLGDAAGVQAARAILQQDASPADPGRFLQEAEEAEPRYGIQAVDGVCYVTQAHDLRPLFKRTPHVGEALEQAAVMARWHQKRDLHNPATRLDDPVDIVVTYDGQEYINQDVTLSYKWEGGKLTSPGFNLEVRLKPNQPTLYFALLYFDGSTGKIFNALIKNGGDWLTHEHSSEEGGLKAQPVFKAYEGRVIHLKIEDELLAQGITRIQDSLKLMLCEEEFDSSLLNQPGLELDSGKGVNRSALNNTLTRLLGDAHRSLALEAEEVDAAPDWTAQLINLYVTRPPEAVAVRERQAVTLLQGEAGDVRIEPHPTFRGLARLAVSRKDNARLVKNTGGVDRNVIPEPAVLSAEAKVFAFSEGRGADLGLDALEIGFGNGASKGVGGTVSADNPLILSTSLPLEPGVGILPYAYDQENKVFLPLGFSRTGADGRTSIVIEALPEAALAMPEEHDRSIGSALKIYFRKLVYRDLLRIDAEIHSLRVFDPQTADYGKEALAPESLAGKPRILLLIHGIIGHSSGMASCLNLIHAEGQASLGSQYDLILTFDYENLNTRLQDAAKALKAQLEQVGVTAASGQRLDILAHSMGGLVARWFIEREGGDALVNRLVMVGTPNGGTPIATLKENGYVVLKTWAYSNLVAILNGLTTAYIGGVVVAGLMKLLDTVSNTLDQMAPDADFIQELANSTAPPNVRYAVIAGDTRGLMISPDRYAERLDKLLEYLGKRFKLAAYDLLTEKLFQEANDMAVGRASMTQFNPALMAAVEVEDVRCDHFSYFLDKATVQKIARQLSL